MTVWSGWKGRLRERDAVCGVVCLSRVGGVAGWNSLLLTGICLGSDCAVPYRSAPLNTMPSGGRGEC